jgi:hypothetical protein
VAFKSVSRETNKPIEIIYNQAKKVLLLHKPPLQKVKTMTHVTIIAQSCTYKDQGHFVSMSFIMFKSPRIQESFDCKDEQALDDACGVMNESAKAAWGENQAFSLSIHKKFNSRAFRNFESLSRVVAEKNSNKIITIVDNPNKNITSDLVTA